MRNERLFGVTCCLATLCLYVAVLSGCQPALVSSPASTWHQKCGWNAEDYFEDSKVVALCRAIEANDLSEIDRLVASGADVNAKGKGNMTPLLWAFPDNKLARFERLLKHGANPNVVIESDFNTHGSMVVGDSVTHMACRTSFPGYFEAVFDYGGDPNLLKSGVISGDSPLFSVITGSSPDKLKNVQVLIEKRADINHMNGAPCTPTMQAVTWGGQYDLALKLLEAGADYNVYKPRSNLKLIHLVVGEQQRREALWTPEQKKDFNKLLAWLVARGESPQDARKDIERWATMGATPQEFRKKMDAEVAARKAREAREKAAAQKPDDVK